MPDPLDNDLWCEFLSPDHLCGLCGNTGIIDTRGHVSSPAGVACGVRCWCICPNGRAWKARDLRLPPAPMTGELANELL